MVFETLRGQMLGNLPDRCTTDEAPTVNPQTTFPPAGTSAAGGPANRLAGPAAPG
jgi:hypothetical protein